jgi:hypothetical protein
MTSIWIAGGENPDHHELFGICGVDKVAINVGSWRRNYRSNWSLKDGFVPGEWIAWSDTVGTLDDLLELVDLIGCNPVAAVGPEEWESHNNYMPLWDGNSGAPASFVGSGFFVTDKVFSDKNLNSQVLGSRKRDMTLGVVTGKSRGIDRYDHVISSAWWSVMKNGETQLWDGVHFHRVNAKSKTDFRRQHAESIKRLGINDWDVLADEPQAVAALAVKSWMAYEEQKLGTAAVLSIVKNESEVATAPSDDIEESGTPVRVVDTRQGRERHVLPSMALYTTAEAEGDPLIGSSSESLRQCNNCHLAAACPAFESDHSCAYAIPVEIRTKDQLQKVMQAVIEIQTQRVFQSRFAEEITGQELSPEVGKEMDRLFKLVENMRNIVDNRDTLTVAIQAKGGADGGVLSKLFGASVGTAAKALDSPVDPDDIIDVIDS